MKNKKRIFFISAIVCLMVLGAITLGACSIDDVEEIAVTPGEISVRVGEFEYADYTVTATYHSGNREEFALSPEMIAANDRLKFFIEGDYEIPVSYKNKSATMKVNVRRNVFADAEFADLDVVYTGEFYTVEVKNVPEGTTVTYPTTNRFRNAGEYEATAILRRDAYEMKEMKAKVTIRKADYDLSNLVFADKTETYDGNPHVLALEGDVPVGLYVDYRITREGGKEESGNSAKNAGVYTVQAMFMGDSANYNLVAPKEAVLTIEQAAFDVSGIQFESRTEVYDRTRHELKVEGTLPQGVSVKYENNGQISAGTYEVKAVFAVEDTVNYKPIETKTATLTIEKADYDMSAVHFNGTHVSYDGTEKKIELQGTLPVGVSVSYTQNTAVNAGTYRATATFTVSDKNYNAPRSLIADLIIDPVAAEMDKVVFERRRFISRDRALLDQSIDELEEFDEEFIDSYDESYIAFIRAIQYYDPYAVAMQYRPTNLPVGMDVASVEYYKTDGWVEDLTSFEVHGKDALSKISEEGYYVVVVGFDGHGNYTSITPVRTQIRMDTVEAFPDVKFTLNGENWLDRATNTRYDSVYFDYNYETCTEEDVRRSVGAVDFHYCDCNVFLDYRAGGADAIVCTYDADMPDAIRTETYKIPFEGVTLNKEVPDTTRQAFERFAKYAEVLLRYCNEQSIQNFFGINMYKNMLETFMPYASAASVGPKYDSEPMAMEQNAVAVVGLDHDFAQSVNTPMSVGDYRAFVAKMFGYTDVDAFLSDVSGVRDTMLRNAARASMDTVADQCVYEGAVYESVEGGNMFILPYRFVWWPDVGDGIEMREIFVYVIFDNAQTSNRTTVFISDAGILNDYLNNTENGSVIVYGRCKTTESPGYRWYPRTRTDVVDGQEETRYVTSGNESFSFAGAKGTDNLEEVRSVYKFRSTLPGDCTETMEGYDSADYTVSTDRSVVRFCEDDLLSKVLKAGGDVSVLAKREARADHAQFKDETIAAFDCLSEYFAAFFESRPDEDYWRLDTNNRFYGAYSEFFDFAQVLYSSANRNYGRHAEYTTADSVIIGLSRAFAIWVNGSGVDCTVDEYRTIVMRLFGYEDLETLTSHTAAIGQTLAANEKRSSAEFASTRFLYDGAIYTSNGYFVLPYVFDSALSKSRVLSFIFVTPDGNMAIWLNNVKNARNAVDFPADEETEINVVGRCLLFEDDGYTMLDNLDNEFVDIVTDLQDALLNPFTGHTALDDLPIAIERIGNISGTGEFVVYTELRDSEGFVVNLSSVYNYQIQPEIETGFYTLVTVASLDDARAYNLVAKQEAQIAPPPIDENDDTSDSEEE